MVFTQGIEAETIIKSFLIVIALLMFRNFITNIIVKLIRRLTKKYDLKNIAIIIDSIERPLVNFFTYTAVYLGLMVLPLSTNIHLFVNRVYRTCIIITATQCLIRIVTAYSDFLNSNYLQDSGKIGKNQMTKTVFPILSKLIKAVIIIIAVVAIAVEFNFRQLSSILAGLGIGGAALALASQDLIKNFFGGFVILTDKSFNVGDWIKVDSFEGAVEELGLRSTKIRTIEKELVIVPNSRFADREVVNYSIRENRRVNFTLGAVYGTDPERLKSAMEKIKSMLDSHRMIQEESTLVKFSDFGQSSLEIVVQYFTKTSAYNEYMDIKNDVNFKIMNIFKEEGIEFAFPSMSIYMNK
ncbi:MAG TPA: hypothetical protein DCM73_10695 [Clostridiales bacterium]|nr:hypothetical protein [Clostridiales bacterium]